MPSDLRPAEHASGEAEEIFREGNTVLHRGVLERGLWWRGVNVERRGRNARGREGSSEAAVGTEGRGEGDSEDGEARPSVT